MIADSKMLSIVCKWHNGEEVAVQHLLLSAHPPAVRDISIDMPSQIKRRFTPHPKIRRFREPQTCIIASFLRYTDYLNITKCPISHVLLYILIHVLLLNCLYFWLLVSLQLKSMLLNIVKQFLRGMVKIYFGLPNNSGEIRILMISRLSLLHCLII